MSTIHDSTNDPFADIFGVRRGYSPTKDAPASPVSGVSGKNAFDYLAEAHRLSDHDWPLEELHKHSGFQPVITSTLVKLPKGSSEYGDYRRVHAGINTNDESEKQFALLIVEKEGRGFEEPYGTWIMHSDNLERLLSRADELLDAGKRFRNDAGADTLTEEDFATAFKERLS